MRPILITQNFKHEYVRIKEIHFLKKIEHIYTAVKIFNPARQEKSSSSSSVVTSLSVMSHKVMWVHHWISINLKIHTFKLYFVSGEIVDKFCVSVERSIIS